MFVKSQVFLAWLALASISVFFHLRQSNPVEAVQQVVLIISIWQQLDSWHRQQRKTSNHLLKLPLLAILLLINTILSILLVIDSGLTMLILKIVSSPTPFLKQAFLSSLSSHWDSCMHSTIANVVLKRVLSTHFSIGLIFSSIATLKVMEVELPDPILKATVKTVILIPIFGEEIGLLPALIVLALISYAYDQQKRKKATTKIKKKIKKLEKKKETLQRMLNENPTMELVDKLELTDAKLERKKAAQHEPAVDRLHLNWWILFFLLFEELDFFCFYIHPPWSIIWTFKQAFNNLHFVFLTRK